MDRTALGGIRLPWRAPAGRPSPEEPPAERPRRPFWKELPVLVVIALLLALLIKTFFVQAFSIPSASMENTLRIGDRVLVDKLTPTFGSEPSRGEVVVFHDPGDWLRAEQQHRGSGNAFLRGLQDVFSTVGLAPSADEKDLIKRVIAVGGDTVSCHGTGPVYVNGKALDEPYLYPGSTPCGDRNFGPLTVPAHSLWVLGDNRQNSGDSRYNMAGPGGGFVPESKVIGRAITVAWPVTHWKTLPIPDTFSQPGISDRAATLAGSHPVLASLAGAAPLTLLRRRWRLRSARRGAGRKSR
ncbi:signal peptidase I [Kitasatospora sp. LaBMicrA B282]|uniref:signal peptidase I n=1 Tax=Kitasatospora sp. LaBMicrA B282 TaxID=3420949 RepID=UPI003D0FC0BA